MKNSGKKISIFIIIFGIALIIGGIYNKYTIDNMRNNAVETKAIVTSIHHNNKISMDTRQSRKKSDYTIYISYTVDGLEYNTSFKSLNPISTDTEITIYYDKTNPEIITRTLDTEGSITMSLVGIPIVILGIVLLIKKVKIITGTNNKL